MAFHHYVEQAQQLAVCFGGRLLHSIPNLGLQAYQLSHVVYLKGPPILDRLHELLIRLHRLVQVGDEWAARLRLPAA